MTMHFVPTWTGYHHTPSTKPAPAVAQAHSTLSSAISTPEDVAALLASVRKKHAAQQATSLVSQVEAVAAILVNMRKPTTTPPPLEPISPNWKRILRASVQLTNMRLLPFPMYLNFKAIAKLRNGSDAAVFELRHANLQIQAWLVADFQTGAPRVVHAVGGVNKDTDFIVAG